MFFMSIAVGTAVHRKIRRNVRPWFLAEDGKSPGKYKGVYDLLSFVLTHCTLMYFIISFAMLSWEASIRVFRSQYFIGNTGLSFHYFERRGLTGFFMPVLYFHRTHTGRCVVHCAFFGHHPTAEENRFGEKDPVRAKFLVGPGFGGPEFFSRHTYCRVLLLWSTARRLIYDRIR
mmetsp:Transcript_36678/g.146684  ORF Transcript_36678/g.146684 Transcript_36678/m.146684 type:complete len:174 (-) Transcript_36678:4881-5402(-)